MKKLLLSTVGLLALGAFSPVFAADMAVRAAPPPAPFPVIYDWSGFYIGINGGRGNSQNFWAFVTLAGPVVSDGCRDRFGGLFGGPVGYRLQGPGQLGFGLEAQRELADPGHTRGS